MHPKITVSPVMMFLLGFTLPVGEQMNQYLPYASKWFAAAGLMAILYAGIVIVKENNGQLSKLQMQLMLIFMFIVFINASRMILGLDSLSMHFLQEALFALIALAITMIAPRNEHTYRAFLTGYIISFFILTFFSSYNTYYGNEVRFVGTYSNPNRYAVDIMLALYILIGFIIDHKKILLRIVFILLSLFCVYLLLKTGTRSVLLAVLICALFYICYRFSAKQKIILSVTIPFIALSIFLLFAGETLFQRFMGGNYASSGYNDNIRWGIWQNYLSNIDKYWLTGISEQQMYAISKKSPHNTYLGILVRYGVVSFGVTLLLILNLLKRAVADIKQAAYNGKKMMVYALLSILVVCMFMEMHQIRLFWVVLAMGIVILDQEAAPKKYMV